MWKGVSLLKYIIWGLKSYFGVNFEFWIGDIIYKTLINGYIDDKFGIRTTERKTWHE